MNKQLLDNIQSQTKRLISQLEELEEMKGELDKEEYESMKKDTLDQLQLFEKSLNDKLKSGDIGLLDEIKKSQLEIQKNIKKYFNVEKIKESLSQGEVSNLRDKIEILTRDFNLSKINEQKFIKDKLVFINLINDLKADLSAEEKSFLDQHTGKANFVKAKTQVMEKGLLKEAEKQMEINKLTNK